MTAFPLDTSGAVATNSPPNNIHHTFWSDLNPFTQGYVEAGFRELFETVKGAVYAGRNGGEMRFDWLASETLDVILKDCEEAQRLWPLATTRDEDGGTFWRQRQLMYFAGFGPLTITLGEDGKVVFQ